MAYDGIHRFTSVGTVVTEKNFIGRRAALEEIESTVILPDEQRGCIAIVGLPQTGKRCLAHRALLGRKDALHRKRLLPIDMSLKAYTRSDDFFKELVTLCEDELEECKDEFQIDTTQVHSAAKAAREEGLSWGTSISRIKRFFKQVGKLKLSFAVVLRDFDHAGVLFQDDVRSRGFRELADPECHLTWIALANKPIRDIEAKEGSISAKLFDECKPGMYEEDEMEIYYKHLEGTNVNLTRQHKELIDFYCGRHPYLLTLLGKQLSHRFSNSSSEIDVTRAFHEVEQQFHAYYKTLTAFFYDYGKLQKLQQILFGPVYELEQSDIDSMLSYGMIRPNSAWSSHIENTQPAYVAFSQHIQNYLYELLPNHRQDTQLEQIKSVLQDITQTVLDHHRMASFLSATACNTIQELFACIFEHWDVFQPLFSSERGKDKQYWQRGVQFLTLVSNQLVKMQIDNEMLISYKEAQHYCDDILNVLRALEEQIQPAENKQDELVMETVRDGQVLWEQFQVKETIGRTGRNRVVKVWDYLTRHYFAIKLIDRLQGSSDEEIQQRGEMLIREASILMDFTHRNIGAMYGARSKPYGIIMEWVEGKSLHECMREGKHYSASETVKIGIKLADALQYVHKRNVIHRDVKLKNVIIDTEDEPVLIDFDIARSKNVETILHRRYDGSVGFVGTPGYCPPEQLLSPVNVTFSVDVFALAVVLYQLLTGPAWFPYPVLQYQDERYEQSEFFKEKFRLPPPHPNIPNTLYQLLRIALSMDPAQRPTARQFALDLQKCL